MKKKNTHGGARPGSGRKPGPPTVSIAFRVPIDRADELKKRITTMIRRVLSNLKIIW